MTSYTVMQFMDSLMVSHIRPADPVYLTAQGNGGMGAWLAISVVMGLLSIINTYVSQNLGAGKPEEGGRYAWAGLYMSALSGLLLLPYALALPLIYAKSGHGPRLLELESQYAQVLLVGAVFTIGARTLSHYFYGMHRSLVVFVAAISGNVVNVLLNIFLIFGDEGMPTTGIALIDAPASWIASLAGAVGRLLVLLAGADFTLGEAVILHQRNVAGTHIGTSAAIDAIEQMIALRLAEIPGARVPVQIHGLQIGRTRFRAASAADAR